MNLKEAEEVLKQHNYIMLEDKYMDDMDDELDSTISFSTIKNIVENKYKTEIKNGELYAYPFEDKKNIQIRIDSRGRNSVCSIFGVYLVDSNGETYTVKKCYKYYVSKKNPEIHYLGKDNGYMEEYGGSEEEILKPAEEALAKLNKPGFFKRLFHKESAQESVETLSKAGFLVEASDKAKSIRDQITRAAIEKFEEIPYDEFEQEPWEDSDAIDAIPDEKFFEVMKSAINVKTQEEVLQAAEDEDKFNILADAWLEYLSDLSGYVGWEYTWNRDY